MQETFDLHAGTILHGICNKRKALSSEDGRTYLELVTSGIAPKVVLRTREYSFGSPYGSELPCVGFPASPAQRLATRRDDNQTATENPGICFHQQPHESEDKAYQNWDDFG